MSPLLDLHFLHSFYVLSSPDGVYVHLLGDRAKSRGRQVDIGCFMPVMKPHGFIYLTTTIFPVKDWLPAVRR
jgi:hypothetical protein